VDYFAKLVENTAIANLGYNMSVSAWVEQEDTREVVDIEQLNGAIANIVGRQSDLRSQIDAIVADLEGVAA